MAKIIKYKVAKLIDYDEATLAEEVDTYKRKLYITVPEKCLETMETSNDSFYKEESRTPTYSDEYSLTDPEDYQKSLSPMSYESCTSENFNITRNEDLLKTVTKGLNKDERVAKNEGIDIFISVHEIINMDMQELKEKLLEHIALNGMTQDQYDSSMAIRKRGKNKEAAQNCRKKKQKEIEILGKQVKIKNNEMEERSVCVEDKRQERDEWSQKLDSICAFILHKENLDKNVWEVDVDGDEVLFKRRKGPVMPPLLKIQDLHAPLDLKCIPPLARNARFHPFPPRGLLY